LAGNLRRAARRHREQVEEYLDARPAEWEALVESAPGDAADVLEELSEEAALDLLAELDPGSAADQHAGTSPSSTPSARDVERPAASSLAKARNPSARSAAVARDPRPVGPRGLEISVG
jgi:hypothetical protein